MLNVLANNRGTMAQPENQVEHLAPVFLTATFPVEGLIGGDRGPDFGIFQDGRHRDCRSVSAGNRNCVIWARDLW